MIQYNACKNHQSGDIIIHAHVDIKVICFQHYVKIGLGLRPMYSVFQRVRQGFSTSKLSNKLMDWFMHYRAHAGYDLGI